MFRNAWEMGFLTYLLSFTVLLLLYWVAGKVLFVRRLGGQRLWWFAALGTACLLPLMVLTSPRIQEVVLGEGRFWKGAQGWIRDFLQGLPPVEIDALLLLKAGYFLGLAVLLLRWVDRLWKRERPPAHSPESWMELGVEGLARFFWFHPLVWGFRRAFRQAGDSRGNEAAALTGVVAGAVVWVFLLGAIPDGARHQLARWDEALTQALWAYQPPKPETPVLLWGERRFPLERLRGRERLAEAEIERDSLLRLFHEPLLVLQGGDTLRPPSQTFRLEKFSGPNRRWVPEVPNDSLRFDHPPFADMVDLLEPGDRLVIGNWSEPAWRLELTLRLPKTLYLPPVALAPVPRPAASYRFQVVYRPEAPVLVRLDTTYPGTRHIFELYRDRPNYEVRHIPDFQTRQRVVEAWQQVRARQTASLRLGPSEKELGAYDYPEYWGYDREILRLRWGEMEAAPLSSNYSLQTFRRNYHRPLLLLQGEQPLPLRRMEVVIATEGKPLRTFAVDRANFPFLRRWWEGLPPESTVYFRHLLIEGDAGELLHLPLEFAFVISPEDQAYRFRLAPGHPDSLPTLALDSTRWVFRNFPFSWLYRATGAQERFVFPEGVPEPCLDLEIEGESLPLLKPGRLLERHLAHQFGYDTYYRREYPKVWVLEGVEEEPSSGQPYPRWFLELWLERLSGTPVVAAGDRQASVHLPHLPESWSEARRMLQEQGLRLRRAERRIRYRVVMKPES